jgi:hypothetical protein
VKRPHAYRPNPWIGLVGLLGYGLVAIIVAGAVWFGLALLLAGARP